MKRWKWLWICFFLLFATLLYAEGGSELAALQRSAALSKNLDGYLNVCEYLYETEEDPDLLLLYADSIRQLAVSTKEPKLFVEYNIWKSEAYFNKGDFGKGTALKREAIALAKKYGMKTHIVRSCSDMGYYFNTYSRYDSARYYFQEGLEIGLKLSSPVVKQFCRTMLTNYASSYFFEGQTDSALVYAIRAKELSAIDKDTFMLIENLNQLGAIYKRKKNLESCIESFEQAIHLCEKKNGFASIAFIYGNIATAYSDWKRPKDALIFSKKALENALITGNKRQIGICSVNLGAIQCNINELRDEGISTLLNIIPTLEEVNERRQLCNTYDYLINAYQQSGQREFVQKYLMKFAKLVDELQTDVERFRYYKVKALFLQNDGDYKGAIPYYLKMTEMIQNGYKETFDYERYKQLSECYRHTNNFAAAYNNLWQAYTLRDSVFHFEQTEQLSNYSIKYQTKEKELEILRLRKEQLERETQTLRHRIWAGIVFLFLLILFLIMLYRRQRQKVKITELAHAIGEKECQFLDLQKETEQRLTRKYIDGLESERERIATELHDDVCNSLLAFEMKMSVNLDKANSLFCDEQLVTLEGIRERLRKLSHELMPPVFQYATIDEMLADYVLHLELPVQTEVKYCSTKGVDWNQIPKEVGFECYRIAQEAVGNAVKYAKATIIRVDLILELGQLLLQITDNGVGFDLHKKSSGVGLHIMQQRATMLQGKVVLSSVIGKGTQVKVIILIS